MKLRDGEEKQRRAREAREKAEVERAARAARKRALVDMNAHETQEGVMDSLMEALQTGSAFSRPDQRRKRQTRVAGGKFKLIRGRHGPTKIMKWSPASGAKIFDGSLALLSTKNVDSNCNRNIIDENSSLHSPTDTIVRAVSRDPQMYFTPEENQMELKKFLLNEAKKTPKRDGFLSRVSTFQRKSRKSHAKGGLKPLAYLASPLFGKTPRREVSIRVHRNIGLLHLDSLSSVDTFHSANSNFLTVPSPYRGVGKSDKTEDVRDSKNSLSVTNGTGAIPKVRRDGAASPKNRASKYLHLSASYESVVGEFMKRNNDRLLTPRSPIAKPSLYRETLIGEARRLTPVKQKRVFIGRRHKRNGIVRRAIVNRKKFTQNKQARRTKLRNYLGSPPNMNSSMPEIIIDGSPIACGLGRINEKNYEKISKSTDYMSADECPMQLLPRTKHFENISMVHDENQNDIVLGRGATSDAFFDISPLEKTTFVSSSSIHSPKGFEISGILEMSAYKSPLIVTEAADRESKFKKYGSGSPTTPNLLEMSGSAKASTPQPGGKTPHTPESVERISGDEKNVYKLLDPPSGGKKNWKFWQKDENDKIVILKYNKLSTSDSDGAGNVNEIVSHGVISP